MMIFISWFVIHPVVQMSYPICDRGLMRPRSLSRTSRRCSSRKKPTPKTSGIIFSYIEVHSCFWRAHAGSCTSPRRKSASCVVSRIEAMCRRLMASKYEKYASFGLGAGYRRRCRLPMRCFTQCRPSDGAESATRPLRTRHVMRSESRSAMHSWLRINMCSSFGSRRRASRKGLQSSAHVPALGGSLNYLDKLSGTSSAQRMLRTLFSEASSLLAALRQLGRLLLIPFSATAAVSAVLARSGVGLPRRDFSIDASVFLKKKYYFAVCRLSPQTRQGSVVG